MEPPHAVLAKSTRSFWLQIGKHLFKYSMLFSIRNMNKRFNDIVAQNEQLRAMIPEDKLSTLKLQSIQLATITALPSPTASDHLPLAAKTPRLSSQSLSSTPPRQKQSNTPPPTNIVENVPKTTPQQPNHTDPAPFPMALLAAAAFNLQQPGRFPPMPHQQMPAFAQPPQLCMKRFNPSSFCLCVACLMQNGNLNATFVGRSMRQNANR